MNNLPQPLWAIFLAGLGVALALAALFHPEPLTVVTSVLAIASNLVSGALGAFAGHAGASVNNSTVTLPPSSAIKPSPETLP
jgi:Kef-type K+ transport system membrane component KefB